MTDLGSSDARQRLGDHRHTTLQAALDWSWDLLEPWEQSALAQCSVFRGGFDWTAVEAIVDLDLWPKPPGASMLSELVDRSLSLALLRLLLLLLLLLLSPNMPRLGSVHAAVAAVIDETRRPR